MFEQYKPKELVEEVEEVVEVEDIFEAIGEDHEIDALLEYDDEVAALEYDDEVADLEYDDEIDAEEGDAEEVDEEEVDPNAPVMILNYQGILVNANPSEEEIKWAYENLTRDPITGEYWGRPQREGRTKREAHTRDARSVRKQHVPDTRSYKNLPDEPMDEPRRRNRGGKDEDMFGNVMDFNRFDTVHNIDDHHQF